MDQLDYNDPDDHLTYLKRYINRTTDEDIDDEIDDLMCEYGGNEYQFGIEMDLPPPGKPSEHQIQLHFRNSYDAAIRSIESSQYIQFVKYILEKKLNYNPYLGYERGIFHPNGQSQSTTRKLPKCRNKVDLHINRMNYISMHATIRECTAEIIASHNRIAIRTISKIGMNRRSRNYAYGKKIYSPTINSIDGCEFPTPLSLHDIHY